MNRLPTYRVLCIDGGRLHGIYTAAYLNELGRRYAAHRDLNNVGLDLGKGFDLVVGTSTGAIINEIMKLEVRVKMQSFLVR